MKLVLAVTVAFLATSALAAPPNKEQPSGHSYSSFAESSVVAPSAVTVHRYSFTVGAGGNSPLMAIPKNKAVLLMATGDTSGERGVGHVTIWSPHGEFLQWSGQDVQAEENNYSTEASHILWLDFNSRKLELQVADPSHVKVHNAFTQAEKAELTLIY